MKELTIEEKAQHYDAAINRANSLLSGNQLGNAWVYKVLPELKESEDERIRKEIIQFLKLPHPQFVGNRNYEKWIDYLEKQGKNDMGISEATKRELEDKLHKALEKETAESFNKFLGEQKPAEKVEPKFKIGDWVVIDGEVLHVREVTEDGYLTDEGWLIPFRSEKEAHIWTIQDAKDGDVLSYRNGQWIFILKRIIDKDSFEYYALWSTTHNDLTINDSAFSLLINSIYPATKEQRDLLFQKIHEAGYEWDSEKKELKKEEEVYNLHNYLYGKQDPIWSEEDKAILEKCIGAVKVSCYSQSFKSEAENWLKSLRPQSQWRPSDEQMDAIKDAIDYLGCNTKKVREYLMSLYEQLKKLRGE